MTEFTDKRITARHPYLKSIAGFTIVELLIVIVVIGILAAIVIVAYSGIQRSANQSSVVNEARQWEKLLNVYKAQFGELPPITPGYYCLGTGFPNGKCRHPSSTDTSLYYNEADNAVLMAELAKVGSPPLNSRKIVTDGAVGPYVQVRNTDYLLTAVVPVTSANECQKFNLVQGYTNGSATFSFCRIDMQRQ